MKKVDEVELKVLEIEPGDSSPFHAHSHPHKGIVVTGSGALQLTGRRLPLAPSDVFTVAPNEPHAVVNDGPGSLRLVCMDCFIDTAS